MILVDSSVWIDFLQKRETPETDLLKRVRLTRRLATADLVLAEVLQGSRTEQVADATERMLTAVKIVVISNREIAIAAAQNYRMLRSKGVTVRKTIDTLIATRCIRDNIPLLYSDRDFDPFVEHLGLRSALDFDTGVN